jgi:hypothetical protein
MPRTDVRAQLADPLAQELLHSAIPARLAYVDVDGEPRAVPIGYHWTGEQFVMATEPTTPKVRALRANPKVALTIDTQSFPPHVLLVRGTARIDVVDGVPAEYLTASRRYVPADQWDAFEANVRATYDTMARIAVTPEWVKIMDFETRLPDFLQRRAAAAAHEGD